MTKIDVVLCVCKISYKSVQVCGGYCKMCRGLTFLGHSIYICHFTYCIIGLVVCSHCVDVALFTRAT